MKVNYSYLAEQFANSDPILEDIKKLILSGNFTLGKDLEIFEQKFAQFIKIKYAIGVASGTDALRLSLLALGIKNGDEVITTTNTFFATIGAIVTVGAKPIFIDVKDDYNINPEQIEKAITPRTRAILPVHWHGCPADMVKIIAIANRHNLPVVEDACMALGAEIKGKKMGSFGDTGCFSLHPLKPLNVWGDGGIITTDSEEIKNCLLLLRNHGLKNRDECEFYAFNSRLDPLQAIVGNHMINQVDWIIAQKIKNATIYDKALAKIPQVTIPSRDINTKQVYHNYVVMVEKRDELLSYLLAQGIDAKINYPIPQHLQKASKLFGYKQGDLPQSELQATRIISLPVHQHLSEEQISYTAQKIAEFYK